MTATYVSTSPSIVRRVSIDSVIVVTFDNALDPLSVIEENIIFQNAAGTNIPFVVTLTPSTTINIAASSDLANNTVYIITLTSQITELASPGDAIEDIDPGVEIKFITVESTIVPTIDLTLDGNPNDILFKRNLLMDLFDGREIIESGNKFNFQMVPQTYDETLKTYSNTVDSKITFDNQTLFIDKIRKQELSTFDEYLENIAAFSSLTTAQIDDITKRLITKSFDINSSSGLVAKIEYLMKVYANALGLYFVDVEPDPFKPFVYYISTNLPKNHWSSTIREMVHPVGWSDNYIEIDQTATFQDDATAATYYDYFQTEQYNWTDNYILGADDFSLEFKGFRQGFAIHGQGLGLYIPVTDSTGNPPTAYIPPALGGDQNLEANYSNVIHVESGTGSVTANGDTLTTNIDLTAFVENQFGPAAGYTTSDIYLTIAEGNNKGFYEILTNTALASGNTITVNGLFSETEEELTFWVTDREGTPQTHVLAVLNSLRPKHRWAFSYLQASQLGDVTSDSRLTFDGDGDLQLIVVPGSTITSFTDAPSDTTFLFDSAAVPVLWVQSAGGFLDQDVMSFGNTDLQNGVTSVAALSSGRFYDIDTMSAILSGTTDEQRVVFLDEIDVSPVGEPGLEAGNTLIITGMDDGNNNDTFVVLTHDYPTKSVTITNASAVEELAPSGSPQGEQTIPAHNHVVTFILPATFSNDPQLFTGYAIFFTRNVIDVQDYNSLCEFKYQYTEWNAITAYPVEGTGDTSYDAFVSRLNVESGTLVESNFDTMSASGIFKKYYPSGNNITWTQGKKIYEITRIDLSSDLGVDILGPLFGIVERSEMAYDTWAANTLYTKGDRVHGSGGDSNFIFEADSTEVSDTIEPTWDTTIGNTTTPSGSSMTWTTIDQKNIIVKFTDTLVTEVVLESGINVFTDYTDEANDKIKSSNLSGYDFYADDVPLIPADVTYDSGDQNAIYIGNENPFSHFIIDISTVGAGTWTTTWEYWNGSAWTDLSTLTGFVDNIADFMPASTGKYDLLYTTPTDWAATTIQSGGSSLYWIRGITDYTSHTTLPLAKQIYINTDFNTGDHTFYSENETEDALLTTGSGGQIVDSYTEFGTYISQMVKKTTLSNNIPDCDEYLWTVADETPGVDNQIEYVKNVPDITSNKYVLFSKEDITYSVNLTVTLLEAEVTDILTVADSSGSLGGTYFNLYSGTGTQYHVWYRVSAEADPAPSGSTGLVVDLASDDTAITVAAKSKTVIEETNNSNDFTVTISSNRLIITNQVKAATTRASDGGSGAQTGFDINTTNVGTIGRTNTEDLYDFTGL